MYNSWMGIGGMPLSRNRIVAQLLRSAVPLKSNTTSAASEPRDTKSGSFTSREQQLSKRSSSDLQVRAWISASSKPLTCYTVSSMFILGDAANDDQPCSLDRLPVELLYEIFVHAQNEHFPHTSKYLYAVFKQAPSTIQADYLISRYLAPPMRPETPGIITQALQYPICTSRVIEAILRNPSSTPEIIKPGLRTDLPRRLFRALVVSHISPTKRPTSRKLQRTHSCDPLPFLQYIYSHPDIPGPYSDSWDGYPLIKAVGAEHTELVRFLLDNGASPAWKGGLAVKVAIKRKNIKLVRMLIEPDGSTPLTGDETQPLGAEESDKSLGKRRREPEDQKQGRRKVKRRKMEDRVVVDQAMLNVAVRCDARDIVDYFIKEKGCTPSIQTVLGMR